MFDRTKRVGEMNFIKPNINKIKFIFNFIDTDINKINILLNIIKHDGCPC